MTLRDLLTRAATAPWLTDAAILACALLVAGVLTARGLAFVARCRRRSRAARTVDSGHRGRVKNWELQRRWREGAGEVKR